MATTYREKLLDPRWQRRRLEILGRSDFHCESCGDGTQTLHVHHRRYVKGREPWEYEDHELVTLCASCHSQDHDAREMLDLALCSIDPQFMSWERAIALLCGFLVEQAAFEVETDVERLQMIALSWACEPDAFDVGREANLELQRRVRAKMVAQHGPEVTPFVSSLFGNLLAFPTHRQRFRGHDLLDTSREADALRAVIALPDEMNSQDEFLQALAGTAHEAILVKKIAAVRATLSTYYEKDVIAALMQLQEPPQT